MINFTLLYGGFLSNNILRNSCRLRNISTLKNEVKKDEVKKYDVNEIPKEEVKKLKNGDKK